MSIKHWIPPHCFSASLASSFPPHLSAMLAGKMWRLGFVIPRLRPCSHRFHAIFSSPFSSVLYMHVESPNCPFRHCDSHPLDQDNQWLDLTPSSMQASGASSCSSFVWTVPEFPWLHLFSPTWEKHIHCQNGYSSSPHTGTRNNIYLGVYWAGGICW